MMSRFAQIFNQVLREIIPTQLEIQIIDKIVKELESHLTPRAIELDIKYTKMEPQGSTGIKQTQLKDDFDVDFFIGLDIDQFEDKHKKLSKNKLKEASKQYFLHLCNEWIIKSLKGTKFKEPKLFYAEHPYVRAMYVSEGLEIRVDVVLYLDLNLEFIKENGPITSVDRSPWHGRFIRDNLTIDQKNDVRLLKQFFKACHCYGDKSAVGRMGFIGYSAELLIYYYQSLEALFHDFSNLTNNVFDYYKRSKNQLRKITHMQEDPLIIIDPIDKNRNVASAISLRAYKYCNHKIAQFIQNPVVEYFQILPLKEFTINENHPLCSKTFVIELKNKQADVHYTINRDKLYSLAESIKSNGEREVSHEKRFGSIEFELYFEDSTQEYNLAFYCEQPSISKTFLRQGPPLKDKMHVERFKEKNPEYFEKEKHLWVETNREFTEFAKFLDYHINEKLPDNFSLINVAQSPKAKTASAKKALYVLIQMVLPFLKLSI